MLLSIYLHQEIFEEPESFTVKRNGDQRRARLLRASMMHGSQSLNGSFYQAMMIIDVSSYLPVLRASDWLLEKYTEFGYLHVMFNG